MRRLLLVRHAPTDATRQSAFPRDEPLDDHARAAAARLAGALPKRCEAVSSPALRCRETAAAAGLDAAPDPDLAECDFGSWAGRSLAEIDAADPAGARAWITDPEGAPHGGESLTAFAGRVAGWLDRQAGREGSAVAVTHAGVVKGALVHALGAPIESFWRIDVSPLAITELHAHDGRWTISRVNHPGRRRVTGAALLGGYAADLALGDPRRWHPVAGFGRAAARLERLVYAPSRPRGALFAGALVAAAATAAGLAGRAARRPGFVLAAVTWSALGGRSLTSEARRIAALLEGGDLPAARAALPALVGRDTAQLDEQQVCRAVVESVAENTADAVVGALLWGAVAGPAGVVAYRSANTLDAMVGNRSERYEAFGWAAARLDDAMSWPGARAGAGLAALAAPLVGGSRRAAWDAARRDGPAHPSPNAGCIEAAFAGALGVGLGGPLSYGGRVELRPTLGDGRPPGPPDVRRAARLSLAVGACAAAACALVREAAGRRA